MSNEKSIKIGTLTCRIKVQTPKYSIKVNQCGITDYEYLTSLPKINSVELKGNKTSVDLGIIIPSKTSDLTNDSGYITKSVNNLYNYTTTSDLTTLLANKQETLVSGTNIKTVNNISVLGNGDISSALNDLSDVTISSPSINQVLLYDGTKWCNANYTVSVAWGNLTGTLSDQSDLNTILTSKANTDISNLSTAGKSLVSGYGMPSTRYTNLTLGASGTNYTAPANGWFAIKGTLAWVDLVAGGTLNFVCESNVSSTYKSAFVPCYKGQVITLSYNNTPSSYTWRFIYAVGEE